MNTLTDEQVYLLNTLAYLDDGGFTEGQDLGTIANEIYRNADKYAGEFQSVAEIQQVCEAIRNDSTLSSMTMACSETRPGSSGRFVVTTAGTPKEAVVVFQGTVGGQEWRDNFLGGAATDAKDGVSTPCQEDSLAWYQSDKVQSILSECDYVTTSGHSKGGNDAKYITLMDGTIDRCISFDGQGFSDEFLKKYANEIALRQNKITNYSAENDYVNILLNDVGKTQIYIKGKEQSNFLANHSLFTLCDSLPFSENVGKQNKGIAVLNDMLNSHLRSLSDADKQGTLRTLGELFAAMNDNNIDVEETLKTLMSDSNNEKYIGQLLATILMYCRDNPEKVDLLFDALIELFPILKHFRGAADSILEYMRDHPIRTKLIMGGGELLAKYLRGKVEEGSTWEFLLNALIRGLDDFDHRKLKNGSDRVVKSIEDTLRVDNDFLIYCVQQLANVSMALEDASSEIRTAANLCAAQGIRIGLSFMLPFRLPLLSKWLTGKPDVVLNRMCSDARTLAAEAKRLTEAVRKVQGQFEDTESRISARFSG